MGSVHKTSDILKEFCLQNSITTETISGSVNHAQTNMNGLSQAMSDVLSTNQMGLAKYLPESPTGLSKNCNGEQQQVVLSLNENIFQKEQMEPRVATTTILGLCITIVFFIVIRCGIYCLFVLWYSALILTNATKMLFTTIITQFVMCLFVFFTKSSYVIIDAKTSLKQKEELLDENEIEIQLKYGKEIFFDRKLQALEEKLKEKQPKSTRENLIWKKLQTKRIYYITMLVLILIIVVLDSIQYIINKVQLLHCIQYIINKMQSAVFSGVRKRSLKTWVKMKKWVKGKQIQTNKKSKRNIIQQKNRKQHIKRSTWKQY